jgi:hypothetical protein
MVQSMVSPDPVLTSGSICAAARREWRLGCLREGRQADYDSSAKVTE